jgi:hypothetical protein
MFSIFTPIFMLKNAAKVVCDIITDEWDRFIVYPVIVKIFKSVVDRVVDPYLDPDPYWIRIQSGLWIRIWNPYPDPGGQKWSTKVDNNL